MAEYDGSIELISGITQKNGGTFPLVDASAVQIDESGTRLNGWIKTLNASALILGEQDMWVRDSAQPSEFIYHATPIAPFSPSTAYVIKTACENNDAEIWIQYEYSQEWHEAHPSSEGGVQVIKDTGAGLQNKAFTTKSISDGVVSIVKVTAKGFTEEEIANTNIVPYNTTYSVAESGYAIAAGESSHAEGRGTKALAPFSHVEGSGTSAGVSVMSNKGNSAHAEGSNTSARGNYSHSEGQHTSAQGSYSHAEGNSTLAQGNGAHAEGYGALGTKEINNTTYNESGAYGNYSHTEGSGTWAVGANSHAEGHETVASSSHSHAEGDGTEARGESSHAEGQCTIANHLAQHVFGRYNIEDPSNAASNALGNYIEIVGNGTSNSARSNARTLDENGNEVLAGTLTVGTSPTANMHVATKQYVDNAISVNDAMVFKGTIGSSGATVSSLPATHKAGWAYKVATASTYAGVTCEIGDLIICVVDGTSANDADWTVVQNNIEPDVYALKNNPEFTNSISMGRKAGTTVEYNSIALGGDVTASAPYAHAEGSNTIADGYASHAEGYDTHSSKDFSHAEGRKTTASGYTSHSEGNETTASGTYSHAEGCETVASELAAHAEGYGTIAKGMKSHVSGIYNLPDSTFDNVPNWAANTHYNVGDIVKVEQPLLAPPNSYYKCKTEHTSSSSMNANYWYKLDRFTYAEIVGNGTSDSSRSNARTLDWEGNEVLAGKLTVGENPEYGMDVATKQYVDNAAISIIDNNAGSQEVYRTWNASKLIDQFALKADKTDTVLETTLSRGRNTTSSTGTGSFAFGNSVTASGAYSHAEGAYSRATGDKAHAEGQMTGATGEQSHAEGNQTTASGIQSHAEGGSTIASGLSSHAEGSGTTANHKSQHVFGEYNIADNSAAAATLRGNYIEIVGNGPDNISRSNARTLDWDGNEMIAGSLSRRRKADTVIGAGSVAFGVHAEASGTDSQAFGIMTQAREDGSFAIGIANQDQRTEIIWNKTTSYSSGDIVCIHKGTGLPEQDGVSVVANSDHYFRAKKNVTAGKWPLDADENPDNTDCWEEIPKLILTVGNGRISGEYEEMEPMLAGDSTRRNAFAVDRDGNGFFDGDVYVNADSKSINGTKLATESYVDTAIENDLTMVADFGTISAGTYTNTEFITEGVTASYKAIAIELGNPSAVSTPVNIQTSASTITLSAKFEQATTMKVVLIKCAKTVTAYETALAPDEEEIIPG